MLYRRELYILRCLVVSLWNKLEQTFKKKNRLHLVWIFYNFLGLFHFRLWLFHCRPSVCSRGKTRLFMLLWPAWIRSSLKVNPPFPARAQRLRCKLHADFAFLRGWRRTPAGASLPIPAKHQPCARIHQVNWSLELSDSANRTIGFPYLTVEVLL